MDIEIPIIDICYPRYLRWFLYFINKKFNKNAKKKLTKKLGRRVRHIVIGPYLKPKSAKVE